MRFVPKASVRVNLMIAILLTVILSWVISSGVANYLNYLSFRAFRAEMMKHAGVDARPIPEPKFGVMEFLIGRPPIPRGPGEPGPPRPQGPSFRPVGRPMDRPGDPPPVRSPNLSPLQGLLLRLGVALTLAVLVGAWLGRKFTTPLEQLAMGADAFQAGDFSYRIPKSGTNEFAAVATAMNEMARQVSDQISRLENDAQRRRQFLADVAHELRSPVTTLGTMIAALQDGLAEEPDRKEFAMTALATTSHRLGRLVQDLMDLAKLEVTDLPLSRRDVDLRELVVSAIRSHEAEAIAAGIVMHPLDAGPSIRATVDPDRIAQVFDNIIENAINYAGHGAEVRITLDDGDPVRITISDTGKGIKSADLPYVLDPFYRADAARTPKDCHSGLGLSIAHRLVQAHGGTLGIESEEGKGTTVNIYIPRDSDSGN